MTGFQWIAVAFVTIWFLALVIERVIDAAWNYCFQVDGNHSAGLRQNIQGCTQTETPVSTLTTVGGPFAVDASNGPFQNVDELTPIDREDILRLSALVEFHRVPDGLVPPSRSIRRSIH